MRKKAALHNLGCKVNAYETEAMQELLEDSGYEIVPFHEKADIYIINTCTVTNMADRKSRQMLHRARKMNPDAIVAACGCYVQEKPEEVADCVDIVIGNNRKKEIVHILEAYEKAGKGSEKIWWISAIPGSMRICIFRGQQSIPGPISRCRTDVTSSAPTASFPMPEEEYGAVPWKVCVGKWKHWPGTDIRRSCLPGFI